MGMKVLDGNIVSDALTADTIYQVDIQSFYASKVNVGLKKNNVFLSGLMETQFSGKLSKCINKYI